MSGSGQRPRGRLAARLPARALGAALALLGCAQLLPLSLHPLSEGCPGPLEPVASLPRGLQVHGSYRRIGAEGEESLLLVAERQGDELVLVGLSPVGVHVFTVVQEGREARVEEHVRPLYAHPPTDVLSDLHRALRAGASPGETLEIATPECDYRAQLALY